MGIPNRETHCNIMYTNYSIEKYKRSDRQTTSINVIKVNFPTERKYPSVPIFCFSVFYIFLSGVNAWMLNFLKKFVSHEFLVYLYYLLLIYVSHEFLVYLYYFWFIFFSWPWWGAWLVQASTTPPPIPLLQRGEETGNGVNDGPCLCDEAFLKFPRL